MHSETLRNGLIVDSGAKRWKGGDVTRIRDRPDLNSTGNERESLGHADEDQTIYYRDRVCYELLNQ